MSYVGHIKSNHRVLPLSEDRRAQLGLPETAKVHSVSIDISKKTYAVGDAAPMPLPARFLEVVATVKQDTPHSTMWALFSKYVLTPPHRPTSHIAHLDLSRALVRDASKPLSASYQAQLEEILLTRYALLNAYTQLQTGVLPLLTKKGEAHTQHTRLCEAYETADKAVTALEHLAETLPHSQRKAIKQECTDMHLHITHLKKDIEKTKHTLRTLHETIAQREKEIFQHVCSTEGIDATLFVEIQRSAHETGKTCSECVLKALNEMTKYAVQLLDADKLSTKE